MKTLTKIKLTFIVCTGLAVFFFGQQYVYSVNADREFKFLSDLVYQLLYFYVWGIFFFIITYLADKYRFEKSQLFKSVLVHTSFGFILALSHRILVYLPYVYLFFPEKTSKIFLESGVTKKTLIGAFDSFLAYFLILGTYYGIDYYRKFKENIIRSAELEHQLSQLQLRALKMQLQPHFLFNTLHAISALMEEDVKSARRMQAKLSELLRHTLDNAGSQEIELAEELEFVKGYLEIEQTRFGDRLEVKYDIEENTLIAMVPNLILQPLVENAVKHGISNRAEGGTVTITISVNRNRLQFHICDNGSGNGLKNIKEGIGIRNTRLRLERMYPGDFSFHLADNKDEGFCVYIEIPYKEKDLNDDQTS